MSSEFIDGLEDDLVQAMERYELRSPRRRFATRLRPRRMRPVRLVVVAGAALILVTMIVAARNLAPDPPPARPHVLDVLPIGGIPADAVLADGSLWVSQSAGSVVRIDPVTRRVTGRIAMPTTPGPMAAGAGSIWVQTMGTKDLDCKGSLVRIDPGSGRIAGRIRLPYPLDGPEGPGVLAATRDGGVWLKHGCTWGRRLERRDRGGAVRLSVPVAGVDGISTAGGKLWVIGHDGTLTRVDAATGRIEKRWAKLAPLADPETRGTTALAADRTGVWVLSTGRDAILRVEGGRVVRRIHVGPSTLPLLVNAPDGLWIASADRLGSDYRLIRFDPSTGSPTAVLKLGIQQPIALVPSDGKLCVVTSNGSIVFVG